MPNETINVENAGMPNQVAYGFSTPHSEIETILGLSPGDLRRFSYDLDLLESCRRLSFCEVDLKDEAAVRNAYTAGPLDPPRWVDALVLAAKGYWEKATQPV